MEILTGYPFSMGYEHYLGLRRGNIWFKIRLVRASFVVLVPARAEALHGYISLRI
jgi:hypothetical protein